jgi:hypothetical protein
MKEDPTFITTVESTYKLIQYKVICILKQVYPGTKNSNLNP